MRNTLAALVMTACLLPAARSVPAAEPGVILDEGSYWHQYYRFGPNRISKASDGPDIPAAQRAKREDNGALKVYRDPCIAPPPADDWTSVGFDDQAWVSRRHTFQGEIPPDSKDFLDRSLRVGHYRARFVVDDPAKVGTLTLRMVFRGGATAFINGTEVARGGLPAGDLGPDAAADVYPVSAYPQPPEMPPAAVVRERTVGPISIPARLLRKGVNVLAVEVRASPLHPVVLTYPVQRNWCDPLRSWPHAHLAALELKAATPAAVTQAGRPAGVQLQARDIHHRVTSDEFLPSGEDPGTVRIVAAANGTFAGQFVIGTDRDLSQLQVTVGQLQATSSQALPASAVTVLYGVPLPTEEFTLAKLGDEKGLDSQFPSQRALEAMERAAGAGKPALFDHLRASPPRLVPARTAWPVWLSLRTPAATTPGVYKGSVRVKAEGLEPISLPVEVEVIGWRVPDAKDFQTFVACEQSPYGVARQYDVPLWSAQHIKRLEPSFRQLARVGNRWLHVPMLRNTEFGNRDDSMIRIVRRRDGRLDCDFTVLDKYLDLAKAWDRPPVISLAVMHGQKAKINVAPELMVLDEATRRRSPVSAGSTPKEVQDLWTPVATAIAKHMEERHLKGSWYWGYPCDGEEDPNLTKALAGILPDVYWTRAPHVLLRNYAPDTQFFRLLAVPRYWTDAEPLPDYRGDMGWKHGRVTQLLSPRVDSTLIAIQTVSHPFAYRIMTDRALATGRAGIGRIAVDSWAGVYFDGMAPRQWIVGLPVLHTLWPGPDGAETGQRFEVMIEGIQEAEARIALEQAVDARRLSPDLAARATQALAERFRATTFLQPNITVYELEQNYHGWQERSRGLYRLAAEALRAKE